MNRIDNAWASPVKPHEDHTIPKAQLNALRHPQPKDTKLVPEHGGFRLKLATRLEVRTNIGENYANEPSYRL